MHSRIELADLTPEQRAIAAKVVSFAVDRLPWDRVEAILGSLARCERLIPQAAPYATLPLSVPMLLRSERIWAAAILVALHVAVTEDEAEEVVSFLSQRGAPLEVLFAASDPADLNGGKGAQAVV